MPKTEKPNIEKELLEATKSKPKKNGEKESKYLNRIAKACAELEDADFAKLSEDAQQWINTAAEQINSGKEPDSFPKAESEEEATEEAGDGKEEEETEKLTKPAKKGGAKKGSKSETKADDDDDKKKRGVSRRLRELWVSNPKLTVEDALKKVTDEGYTTTAATASMAKREVALVIDILTEKGKLK
jgi:hypothetical protein